MATANIFSNAKKVAPTASASKAKDKTEVEIEGLEALASISAAIKALEALKETYEANVKEQVIDRFADTGMAFAKAGAPKKPDSFRGVEGDVSASCELRKRSVASALNDAEIDLCNRFSIPVAKRVKTVGCFVINPAYKDNQDVLANVSKALSKVKDLPADFIMEQEEVSSTVVADNAFEVVFTKGDKEVVKQLLTVVGSCAVGKFNNAKGDVEVKDVLAAVIKAI